MKALASFHSFPSSAGSGRGLGFAVVLALHLLLGWALLAGLATRQPKAPQGVVPVALMAEPEPIKPPEPVVLPSVQAPPPAQPKVLAPIAPVPPPVPVTPAPSPHPPAVAEAVLARAEQMSPSAITPTTTAAAPLITAPEPMAAAPANATNKAPLATPAMGVVCPSQVKPTMPRRAELEQISGHVKARATVRAGRVVAVEIISSRPRGLFDAAVRQAMLQYRCESVGEGDQHPEQEFDFKFEE